MNSRPSRKYKLVPKEVENNTIGSEATRRRFDFARLEKINREKSRLEKFHKKIYKRKKLKLRSLLELGEEVLTLAQELEKKDDPGRFYKNSVDNEPYFHNQESQLETEKTEEKFFFTG